MDPSLPPMQQPAVPAPPQQPPAGGWRERLGSYHRLVVASGILLLCVALGLIWVGLRGNAGGSGAGNKGHTAPPAIAVVEITPSGFVPSTLSVSPNTNVVWVNEDVMPHLPAADPYPNHSSLPALVAPKALGQKETYTFLVSRKETIHYHDDINPVLTGTVEVR